MEDDVEAFGAEFVRYCLADSIAATSDKCPGIVVFVILSDGARPDVRVKEVR